jgi:hypothetical protein
MTRSSTLRRRVWIARAGAGLLVTITVAATFGLLGGLPSGHSHLVQPAVCTCACYNTCQTQCPEGTVSFSIVSVTYPTPTTITLGVQTNVDTSPFEIQWGPTTSYGSSWSQNPEPTDFAVTIGPLNAGTTYYYELTGSASCFNSGSYKGSVNSYGNVYGSFTASGAFPSWNYCVLGACTAPCGSSTLGHQTVISIGDAISTWVSGGRFQSTIWENQSSGGTGLNTYWGCDTTYSGGSVTWGSTLSCDGGYQERTFSWDPSFTQVWEDPFTAFPSDTATFNIQVEVCAAGSISVYMTLSSALLANWVGLAYGVVTIPF